MTRQRLRFSIAFAIACAAAAWAAAAENARPESVAAAQPAESNPGNLVTLPALSADQIVEKNVAARGGLEAWRKIQTMVWTGHIESASASAPMLFFTLQLKRPNKSRFEMNAMGQKSARIFDGTNGWKVRPGRGAARDIRPFTLDEIRFAHDEQVIDGLLIDHQAKGIAVEVDGLEEVEGRPAYRLHVTLPSRAEERLWVDAHSFLEIKSAHQVRTSAGLSAWIPVFYRDFRAVEGVQIPFTVETGSAEGKPADRLVIEHVLLNSPLDDLAFAAPAVSHHRGFGLPRTATARSQPHNQFPPVVSDMTAGTPGNTAPSGSSAAKAPPAPAPN